MIQNIGEDTPRLHEDAFIAPSADIIGKVIVEQGASVWYHAVIRADFAEVSIGAHSNVQDGCVIHVDVNCPVKIGQHTTIGHNAIIHGSIIGDRVLIGMGAVVLNGAVIEQGAIIAAGAVVKENQHVPANTLFAGVPAKQVKQLDPSSQMQREQHANQYEQLWRQLYIN